MSVVACLSGGEEIRMKTEVILHIEILAKNTTSLELLDLTVHNFHWFFYKVEFVVELKFFHASLFNDKMTSVHISSSLALQRHMAAADNTSGPVPQSKERCTLQFALSLEEEKSSWLVPNPAPAIPYVPPTNKELELLFQPMFDEYFTPPGDRQVPTINAVQVPVNLTGPSVSISCDQDAPSGSHLTSFSDHQSSLVHHGVAAEQSFEVNPFSAADPEPFVNVFAPDSNSEASSSGVITTTEPNQSTQPHEHL
ncbi:hypothetical protein Tco_0031002 [Tanacetum coccineum]